MDRGIVLIELLVVIVVLAIVAAIAVAAYLGQRQKGVDASIKSDIGHIATAMEGAVSDGYAYSSVPINQAYLTLQGAAFSPGNRYEIATTSAGFCNRGWNPNATADATGGGFWCYDSLNGGLRPGRSSTPPSGGVCEKATNWPGPVRWACAYSDVDSPSHDGAAATTPDDLTADSDTDTNRLCDTDRDGHPVGHPDPRPAPPRPPPMMSARTPRHFRRHPTWGNHGQRDQCRCHG